MTRLTMYQVDAFTSKLFGGNPAAVLILDEWLPDVTMQAIAGENNLAETAFARRSGDGWDLRWFTPVREADFCGHATLATSHVLAHELGVAGELAFQTKVGTLRVTCKNSNYRLDLPSFPPQEIGDLSGPLENALGSSFRAAFRNFENLFVELEDEQALRSFEPDFLRIEQLSPFGLAITARGDAFDFVSRYFAPHAGIPEDPVTGSTHSTLTPYWADKLGKTSLSAFQCSRRGGQLQCELAGDRVLITGSAVTYMKADIYLP